MARAPRTPRAPRGQPTPRRPHAGRITAAAIRAAYTTAVGWGLNQGAPPAPPQAPPAPAAAAAGAPLVPDAAKTPGATPERAKQ